MSCGAPQVPERVQQIVDERRRATKRIEDLEAELAAYGACDPAKMEEKRRAVVLAREAAARWTGAWRAAHSVSRSG